MPARARALTIIDDFGRRVRIIHIPGRQWVAVCVVTRCQEPIGEGHARRLAAIESGEKHLLWHERGSPRCDRPGCGKPLHQAQQKRCAPGKCRTPGA